MSTAEGPSATVLSPDGERRAARARAAAAAPSAPKPDLLGGYAFTALAENVRDYAIFLLEPTGEICYWGEGARLMKWWTRAEAEGSHLRLLYPEECSEDGTAEAHLVEAAEKGEYTGEGRRVRADGSTFWAGVTLTALRDGNGELLGFAKVTRDLTVRRAAEAALAIAWSAHTARDAALADAADARSARDRAREDAEFALEQVRSAREYVSQVLEREVIDLHGERASLLHEMAILNAEIQRLADPESVGGRSSAPG
ncbi:MAG TPA: PAS domain-containing protein [Longimicrobium sp.]|nr:PAS domain-containing protein [Longimicrobium sp.]